MSRNRSTYEAAAGQLISSIQKEWGHHMGEIPAQEQAEAVMNLAHDLLQARSAPGAYALLQGRSVSEYLGNEWVQQHPRVSPQVEALQELIAKS